LIKFIKYIFKEIIINFFLLIYKKPVLKNKSINSYEVMKKITLDNKIYRVFKITDGRSFTDNNTYAAYILPNNQLSNSSYQYFLKKDSKNFTSINFKVTHNPTLTLGTPKFQKKYNNTILSLLSGGASRVNFTHWFEDTLPKLYLFYKCFPDNKIDKILVHSAKKKFQIESLKNFGFKASQIISAEDNKHIKCKVLYVTTHPCNHSPNKVPNWNLKYIKNSFIVKKKSNLLNYKKIYIDRDQDKILNENLYKFRNHRILVNNQEIKKFLLSLNFKIIKPEDLNLYDQIKVFNNARVIVSLYGAAMYMINFCREKTKIIEIKPYKSGNEFLRISNLNNLIHYQIKLKPIIETYNNQQGLLSCQISTLKKYLKK
jgi:hypothetical protein